ncbi:TPA: hypothetical protein N0F65_002974 [Lagenidium giganteum]|uniref:Transmembrane protein n=1 Tax=Lagenidium giganteum TaxID=4803 RepID=A0AAV2YM86_9STRA|nr:TPA: hypothetical protein N0F65_002974 [Lagenidium giganteum]
MLYHTAAILPKVAVDRISAHWSSNPTNIDACIKFSCTRCVVALIAFALMASDIPRTGLGVYELVQRLYARVQPSEYTYFGPYDYPVIHINRSLATDADINTTFQAVSTSFSSTAEKSGPVAAASVWAYKFDTTSIGIRGLALGLQAQGVPSCLQYTFLCPGPTIDLSTAFHMLDGIMDAMATTRKGQTGGHSHNLRTAKRYMFQTHYEWIDRVHHKLASHLGMVETRWRPHFAYWFPKHTKDPNDIVMVCRAAAWRPPFCDHPSRRNLVFPSSRKTRQMLHLWDHIALRVSRLQRLYPTLTLDVLLLETMDSTAKASIGTVFHLHQMNEVVTWVRGRECTSTSTTNETCTTVFVDDYRYERSLLTTDVEEWYLITALLRSAGQSYVWLRLVSLFVGCYNTRRNEFRSHWRWTKKLQIWLSTVLRIPSHVVVYGSLLPVVCYGLAHLLDSNIIHLVLDIRWATSNGFVETDLTQFVPMASIQMRNVWLLSLLVKCAVAFETRWRVSWSPNYGIHGTRGLVISGISLLTIWAPYRELRFRSTRILAFLDDVSTGLAGVMLHTLRPPAVYNRAQEGLPLDAKMLLLSSLSVVFVVLVIKCGDLLIYRSWRHRDLLVARTVAVPYTAGMLWPTTALSGCWQTELTNQPESAQDVPIRTRRSRFSNMLWRSVRGLPMHERALLIEKRSIEINSLFRLMNTVLMSDPIVFFRLRYIGHEVFVYRLLEKSGEPSMKTRNTVANAMPGLEMLGSGSICLMPCHIEMLVEVTDVACFSDFHLVCRMKTTDLSWTMLVQCG